MRNCLFFIGLLIIYHSNTAFTKNALQSAAFDGRAEDEYSDVISNYYEDVDPEEMEYSELKKSDISKDETREILFNPRKRRQRRRKHQGEI